MADLTVTPEAIADQVSKMGDNLGARIATNEDRLKALEAASKRAPALAKPDEFNLRGAIRGALTGRWDGFERVRDEGIEAEKTRDMSVVIGSGGGYIVPATYSPNLIDRLFGQAQLRAMGITEITGVKGKTFTLPRLVSGTTVAYLAENIGLGATAPVFGQEVVEPHLAGAYCAMSRLLAENADPAAEQVVRRVLEEDASRFVDQTGLFGDGTGSNPTGLFNALSPTDHDAQITLDKCLDAITAVEAANGIKNQAKAAFLMHPSLWGTLR